jgi:hypothetical protein
MAKPVPTTITGALAGRAALTTCGKRAVAISMFRKGEGFIGAALAFSREKRNHGIKDEGFEWVELHLWCQGMEVALKGLLLLRNYDHYIKRLKKPLGHDLLRIAKEALAAYALKPLRAGLATELVQLSQLYSLHLLRYGSGYDLLVNPNTVPTGKVFHRLSACFHLAERELRRASLP